MLNLSGLVESLSDLAPFRAGLRAIAAKETPALGAIRSSRPFVVAALANAWRGPVIVITARIDRAYNLSEQLPVWRGAGEGIYRFSEPASLFYERAPWGETAIRARLETLAALMPPEDTDLTPHPPIIVTSARALMQRTLPVSVFRQRSMVLRPGTRHAIEVLVTRWVAMGYEPTSMVIEPGTFSRRGGILDIYPMAHEAPVRIDFFDDEIDSLRTFAPDTQRSVGKIDRLVITPARESLPGDAPAIAESLHLWFEGLPETVADGINPKGDEAPLSSGAAFPFMEHYLPYLYRNPVSLLDYAPDSSLILIEDGPELHETIAEIEAAADASRAEKIRAGTLAPDHPIPYLTWAQISDALRGRPLAYLHNADDSAEETGLLRGLLAPELRFGGQLKNFLPHVRKQRDAGDTVVVLTNQAARLSEIWHEQETEYLSRTESITEPPGPKSLTFVDGMIGEGWRMRTGVGEIHLFTDTEIFGWSRPEPRRRRPSKRARVPELAYADLREGDFVVHVDYGVGRFAGMRKRTIEGLQREYLIIEYGGTDTLFVPIHPADRLTPYVGPDDKPPTLNKLGQADWSRIRGKARQAAEDEARELLDLYAHREAAPGHAFNPDTPWQHELEASFPFIETEDQLRAVREVKQDMESPHPMDRLICGDVGFGKTEVALRAAFKAVNDGKQVAVLVPTTILAEQHYLTFSRRLAAFPIRVDVLSRFRTREEQSRILTQLAAREIDIIIGTHRLLQDDVSLPSIGLMIIDEEQRFGVKHKEHFKKLRSAVDILTLTATPIPRTLYMGLTGVRDISMIQTPPEDRLPVVTHVGVFDERLVRQSVLRELERGGQIFVVHNRVQTIEHLHERLEQIVPEARVIVGHGQMDERLLASVMTAFGNGEYDILLSTSIIESGLDIPNANTLIVDRSDWFGLAQMYQLRGRVGRSAQQAYAYFFHPAHNRLTEEARARLETLAEYTDLGSGFQIAMRDLELRGAGGILSTRQTGHVAAVGLHLYTQMLSEAVRRLRGRSDGGAVPSISESSVLIDLPLPAYLPADTIPDMAQRLQLYRRIGGLTAADQVDEMRDELTDRFGALPPAVEGLLYQIAIKLLAQTSGATALLHRSGVIEVKLPYLVEIDRVRLNNLLGPDTKVTRTAVELPALDDWRERLVSILRLLSRRVREGVGT
ncbi:MAG: transcription-repair coupling factor [Chloroflexi bacterium]|nr:transcription-repair coupling factor [Chloroflexota bacterium]